MSKQAKLNQLKGMIERINELTGNPSGPTKPGAFHLHFPFGKVGLERVVDDAGGTRTLSTLVKYPEMKNALSLALAILEDINAERRAR